MLKFITATVVGAALLVATQATSEAAGRGCGGATYQAGATYTPTYQAAAPGGYRSFSYQPAPAYSSARSMRGTYRQYSGFGDATRKATGKY